MDAGLDISAPQARVAARPSLAGFGRDGLRAALAGVGVPDKQLKMRVGQLWSWIYVRGVTDFHEMSDVSKELRAKLARAYSLDRP
jgi:23S rRNA (adenine2503-C2)-methyltransferase